MKKSVMTVFSLVASLALFAQDRGQGQERTNRTTRNGNRNEAPTQVQQAWQRDYQGSPTWTHANGQWRGHYQDPSTNRSMDAYYNAEGRQIDSHQQVDPSELPKNYQQRLHQRYHSGNYQVTRIHRSGQRDVYELRGTRAASEPTPMKMVMSFDTKIRIIGIRQPKYNDEERPDSGDKSEAILMC